VEDLRQVVAGHVQGPGDVVHTHRALVGLGQVQDGLDGVDRRPGQDHEARFLLGRACLGRILEFIMMI
jgi:hypothetical protein